MKRMFCTVLFALTVTSVSQSPSLPADRISPARPIPTGKAPHMQAKMIESSPAGARWMIVFHKGDEVLSGLTDFCIEHHVNDAQFTAIGAASSATLGWLDLEQKNYRAIPVNEQVEVASLMGDVATFNDKPVVHMHTVLAKHDGSTAAGHVWELNINPTLEVFLTKNNAKLKKKPDEASGMKLIDPTE